MRILTPLVAMLAACSIQAAAPSSSTSSAGSGPSTGREKLAHAVLGGGCFWCLEAVFEDLHGVQDVENGYAGGSVPEPTYEQVCSGTTGHAEVVRIAYDPEIISYEDLLEVFWAIHDPTTKNRQGGDWGTQYRSIVLYESEEQKQAAEASMARAEASGEYSRPFVTEIVPLEAYWPAEAYHQDYFRRNPNKPYCATVAAPKVKKLRERFGDKVKGR